MRALLLSLSVFACAATARLGAQAPSAEWRDDGYAMSLGYSWASPQFWGIIQNRSVTMAELRVETQLVRGPHASLVYTMELPVMVVARQQRHASPACWPRDPSICMSDSSSTMVAGVGALPFGLKLYLGSPRAIRVFGNIGGGFSLFSGNVPTADARRFNFLATGGVGVELTAPGRQRVQAGYRYVHISNGDTAPSNPGLDANVFYVGLVVR